MVIHNFDQVAQRTTLKTTDGIQRINVKKQKTNKPNLKTYAMPVTKYANTVKALFETPNN